MHFDVLTLFPNVFEPYLETSILGRAVERGLCRVHLHQLRDWSKDPHKKVDDRPFGGGPGMVMTCQPILDAAAEVDKLAEVPAFRIAFTPAGELLKQTLVHKLLAQPRLLLLAGRYEGIDQRALDLGHFHEISIGDYVLTGGELPAMVLMDALVRQLPGALGHEQGAEDESFSPANAGMLEAPCYTRPREFGGVAVPEVLIGGNHQQVAAWRSEQSRQRTQQRRPDLLPPKS